MASVNYETLKLIKSLSRLKPKKRNALLKNAPRELIYALSEGALNLLKGNVPVTQQKYAKLKKHRTKIRTLANPNVSLKQ